MRGAFLALALGGILLPGVASAADAARGAAVAEARNCGACHGARGVSEMEGFPSLAGQRPDFVTLQLILFREGLRDVPAMQAPSEGLTDAEVEDLGAYYASLPRGVPPNRGPADRARMEEGARLASAMRCNVCHLPDYSGQNQVPRLTAQREDFLAATLKAYRDGARKGTDTQMNGAVHGVSDASLEALAHYLAHLDP